MRSRAPGRVFDNHGQPVWLRLLHNEDMDVMNFKAQTYKGEEVLTWWEGRHTDYGQGEYVICDRSYRDLPRGCKQCNWASLRSVRCRPTASSIRSDPYAIVGG